MPYDSKAIANYFLDVAATEGKTLTPLQAIKLTFIAHGWHLGLTTRPLVREKPEAWKYGPVFPSLYREFRGYGNDAITGRAMTYADYTADVVPPPSRAHDDTLCNFLDKVWKQYGGFSGGQLSTITHKHGTPWYTTWYELGGKDSKSVVIPDDLILDYYKGLAGKNA